MVVSFQIGGFAGAFAVVAGCAPAPAIPKRSRRLGPGPILPTVAETRN